MRMGSDGCRIIGVRSDLLVPIGFLPEVVHGVPGFSRRVLPMGVKLGQPLGLGPVFEFEWLTSTRRWQAYALRSLFVLFLLTALLVTWSSSGGIGGLSTLQALADVGGFFYVAVIGTQLTLVLLAAPAATAGAICLDRARGSLTHLLVTDLSDAEIVLGKLAARLVPVIGLIVCSLPAVARAEKITITNTLPNTQIVVHIVAVHKGVVTREQPSKLKPTDTTTTSLPGNKIVTIYDANMPGKALFQLPIPAGTEDLPFDIVIQGKGPNAKIKIEPATLSIS